MPPQDRLRLIGPTETDQRQATGVLGRERGHSPFSEALGRLGCGSRREALSVRKTIHGRQGVGQTFPGVEGTLVGRTERAHAAVERASVQRFRVHGMPQVVLEIRQIADAVERGRVSLSVEFDLQLQCPLHQRLRLFETAQGGDVVGQVVHLRHGRWRLLTLQTPPDVESPAMKGFCLLEPTRLLEEIGEVPHRVEGRGMLGAEHAQLCLEIALVQRLSLRVASPRPEQVREIHLVRQHVRMVRSKKLQADVIGLAGERLGLVQTTLTPVEQRQLVHQPDGFLVLVTECGAPKFERTPQLTFGRGILPKLAVRGAQCRSYRGLDQRLAGESSSILRGLIDALRRHVEDLAHADVLALSPPGRRRYGGEEILIEKRVHRFRDRRLTASLNRARGRLPLGAPRLQQRPRRANDPDHKSQDDGRCGEERAPMSPEQLPHAIEPARRPREHGFAVQMAFDIERQRVSGGISPHAVLLERLHRDPVEVAFERPRQASKIRAPVGRRARGRRPEAADSTTGPGRLVFAERPLDFRETRATKLFRVEGPDAREKLVEEHTERVDVRAGVDVEIRHLGLLGTHVLRRANELTQLGEDGALRETLRRGLGNSEVDDLWRVLLVLGRDEHVRRLDVPVDDPLLVRVLDGRADIHE